MVGEIRLEVCSSAAAPFTRPLLRQVAARRDGGDDQGKEILVVARRRRERLRARRSAAKPTEQGGRLKADEKGAQAPGDRPARDGDRQAAFLFGRKIPVDAARRTSFA